MESLVPMFNAPSLSSKRRVTLPIALQVCASLPRSKEALHDAVTRRHCQSWKVSALLVNFPVVVCKGALRQEAQELKSIKGQAIHSRKLFESRFTVICSPASPGDQNYIGFCTAISVRHRAMATSNDTYPLPRNPIPSSPISIVDIFFPGFTNISAAFQQLQGNNPDGYARTLCIFAMVVFFGRYAYNTVKRFVGTYFSPYLPSR